MKKKGEIQNPLAGMNLAEDVVVLENDKQCREGNIPEQ